jgi:Icc protein
MTTLLHLSDPHLDGSRERADRLRAVLDLLPASRRPDAIVVTGDVADNGAAHEYAQFRAVMDGREPWLAVPGNHDTPAELAGLPFLDAGDLRIVGLDVTVAGEDHGELRDEVAERAVSLAADAGQVVLAFHQPPVRIGHSYVDPMRLLDAEPVARLVERIGNVKAILCGHVHTAAASSFAGVPLLIAPGVVSALRPDPDGQPLVDRTQPPGMALHSFENGTVTTTFHYAG